MDDKNYTVFWERDHLIKYDNTYWWTKLKSIGDSRYELKAGYEKEVFVDIHQELCDLVKGRGFMDGIETFGWTLWYGLKDFKKLEDMNTLKEQNMKQQQTIMHWENKSNRLEAENKELRKKLQDLEEKQQENEQQ